MWFAMLLVHTVPTELKRKRKYRREDATALPGSTFALIGCETVPPATNEDEMLTAVNLKVLPGIRTQI